MPTSKQTYILSGTEAFARGVLDNVALANKAVCLEQTAGRHVLCGCYTSTSVHFATFDRLTLSWNADTPRGTVVEAQARVLLEEGWSGWFSFGKWSPYIPRAGVWQPEAAPAYMQGDVLHLTTRASQVQIRIYLYTDNERLTPKVHLLAVSVRPVSWQRQEAAVFDRLLRLPAYSARHRAESLRHMLDIPLALTSIMNRSGQDILPEEVAFGMFDYGAQNSENRCFAAALAGTYGYTAYSSYIDPADVWNLIKIGYSVAVTLRCVDPQANLAQPEPAPPEAPAELPAAVVPAPKRTFFWNRKKQLDQHIEAQKAALEAQQKAYEDALNAPTRLTDRSDRSGKNTMMPLRGFEMENGQAYALVNDPTALTNNAAQRRFAIEEFWNAYTGFALIVPRRDKKRGSGSPVRRRLQLVPTAVAGRYMFQTKDGKTCPLSESMDAVIACTQAGDIPYATTAHHRFYYAQPQPDGSLQLPVESLLGGKKIMVYAIQPNTDTYVGDVSLSG